MMRTIVDDTEILDELNRRLALAGGNQAKLATQLGIPQPYINMILNGKRGISEDVACKLGFVREMRYIKADDCNTYREHNCQEPPYPGTA